MKLLLAADGSKFTKKAIAFLVTHESIAGADDELVVLHVQPPVPPRVKSMLGAAAVARYHKEEAEKVLKPIEAFLKRHPIAFKVRWVIGSASEQILATAKSEKVHLVVMGTHGHGLVGRALMGSVAQRVVPACDVPVLLVK
jgi:nucleotide-binding universal stress UspA family protein